MLTETPMLYCKAVSSELVNSSWTMSMSMYIFTTLRVQQGSSTSTHIGRLRYFLQNLPPQGSKSSKNMERISVILSKNVQIFAV